MFVCCRVPLEPIKVRSQMGATSYHLKKIFPGEPEASPSQELFGCPPTPAAAVDIFQVEIIRRWPFESQLYT